MVKRRRPVAVEQGPGIGRIEVNPGEGFVIGVGGYPLAHQQLEVLSEAQVTAAATAENPDTKNRLAKGPTST